MENPQARSLRTKPITVACLGSSTTASRGTFKWIDELAHRPRNRQFRFVNLGVGGDLAYNALQRLPRVIASHPDKVIVIIGGNDVLAHVFKNVRKFFGGWKRLPHEPSPEWFKQNLEAIVHGLKHGTSADIALVSLPPIGEDPHPTDPVQQELNFRIKQYSQIIQETAREEHVSYIPLYERLQEQIKVSPGPAFTRFSFLSFYRDYVLREFILRKSFDEIARLNGWKFHIDGVHLNTRGGMVLAGLVQDFLDA
ncbi:MAG: GDSL-type esterase/lipase family protein [Patescibacteria group bacterium]